MKRVLDRVAARTDVYARAPFFAFLADPAVEVRRKFGFAPGSAHFVLTFADLTAHVLPQHPPRDRFQELVNATCRDDDEHWRWYLQDLETLGDDRSVRYTDAIRTIWSDRSTRLRLLAYRLCAFAFAGDGLARLVLLQCIESAFQVSVGAILPHARALAERTGKVLYYLGPGHEGAEAEHAIHATDVRAMLREVTLEDARRDALCAMVDEVFDGFDGFVADLHALSG